MSNRAAEWQAEQIQQEVRKRDAERAREAAEGPQSGHTCETCGKATTCDAARHAVTGGRDLSMVCCSKWSASRDSVHHPAHYTAGGVECIEAIAAATTGLQGIEAVCAGNAIKYIWRFSRKNGAEDIEKAIWYLRRLLREIDRGSGEEEAQT